MHFRIIDKLNIKVCLTVFMVALADFLFYKQPIGWALGLYGLIILGAVYVVHGRFFSNTASKISIALLIGLSAALIEQPNVLPCLLFVIGLLTLLVSRHRPAFKTFAEWNYEVGMALLKTMWQASNDSRIITRAKIKRKTKKRHGNIGKKLALAVVPVVMFVIFLFLFAQANPVIADFMQQYSIAALLARLSGLISFNRWIFWLILALLLWGIVRAHYNYKAYQPIVKITNTLDEWFSIKSVMLSLLAFNALFLIQNVLDACFLWGGETLPKSMTYAQYAHAGAYPLIATILLAAGYVILVFGEEGKSYRNALTDKLLYLWIAQNIFLNFSAIDRLIGYVEIYSLTYLRLSAFIWMGPTAGGLVLVVIRLYKHRTNQWLVGANAAMLGAVLYVCCFVNFAAIVANYNVHHTVEISGEGQELDVAYVWQLGPQALPALKWYAEHADVNVNAVGLVKANQAIDRLTNEVQQQRLDWHSFTLQNYALYRKLGY